jgi:hypothetical protein
MLFPVNILPDWLQVVAHFNPVTYALDAMRSALLGGANVADLWRPLAVLLLSALGFHGRLCLGSSPHQDHRHAHPQLKKKAALKLLGLLFLHVNLGVDARSHQLQLF